MRIRPIIELNTPELGEGVPEVPCWAHEVKKPIFGTFLGGGEGLNEMFAGLDPETRIFGMSRRLVHEN